jgi:hypothetical protein
MYHHEQITKLKALVQYLLQLQQYQMRVYCKVILSIKEKER